MNFASAVTPDILELILAYATFYSYDFRQFALVDKQWLSVTKRDSFKSRVTKAPDTLWSYCFLNGSDVVRVMWSKFVNQAVAVGYIVTPSDRINCFLEFCSKEENRAGTSFPWERIRMEKISETTCLNHLIRAMENENYLLALWIRDSILLHFARKHESYQVSRTVSRVVWNDVYQRHFEMFKTEFYGKNHSETKYIKARKWLRKNISKTHELCIYPYAKGAYEIDDETLEIRLKSMYIR